MSIDDDPTTSNEDPNGSHRLPTPSPGDPTQQHLDPSKQQQLKLSSSFSFPVRHASYSTSRESSVEKDDAPDGAAAAAVEKQKQEGNAGEEPSVQSQTSAAAAARRLSVQDRINLFESKQKESGSGSSGGKLVVTKPAELRRLSSDVSSAPSAVERAVLRRWSGVSDMSLSLDLTAGEKKDIIDSPLPCTPSSSSHQAKPEIPKPLNDTPISLLRKDQSDLQAPTRGEEVVTTTKVVGTSSGIPLTVSSNKLEDSSSGSTKYTSTLVKTQSWSSLNKAEDNNLKVPAATSSQLQFKSLPVGRADRFAFVDQGKSKASFGGDDRGGARDQVGSEAKITGPEERTAPKAFGTPASRSADVRSASKLYQPPSAGLSDQREKDQAVSQSRLREPLKTDVDLGQAEGGSQSRIGEAIATVHYKESEGDSSANQLGNSVSKLEESGLQKMKFQTQISAPGQIKKSQGRREESNFAYANSKTACSGISISEGQDGFGLMSMAPLEQVQRGRQSKGNQELNDELKMKAHELEKLFAEHKLRVPENQSNSVRRSKPADAEIGRKQLVDTVPSEFSEQYALVEAFGGSSNVAKLNASSVTDVADGQDYGDALKQNFSELGFSYDSRGKFYEMYMQKRNERLREEWDSKRAEKEAKMKAMHDNLERNSAEMKVKLSGSADGQDSAVSARRRAERLRSFNSRSTMKREQPLDFGQSSDDDDPSEFLERKTFGFDTFGEAPSGNGVSRSSQGKRPLPNRTLPTSTPRTSAAPIPRSAAKATSSGRRRTKAENPLAQSVPNFSDLRKENTKPSSAASKTTIRSQSRNFARSKSNNEEVPLVKEEKPRRSQSLRKSSANPSEFKDTIPLSSEGVVLTPLKFEREQAEQRESKPFLRKNNGIGPGAGVGIAKMKASMVSEAMNNEEEYGELAFEEEDPVDAVKDEEEEESETMTTEEQAAIDQSESRLSQESERLMNSGSENGDGLRSFSQVAELPTAMPSTFHPLGSVQDSPGESPMSWNYRTQHPFSYPHEASDVDASAYSPIGSPASWNLHSLNQTEAEAARMRKKWGSAQKPVLVSSSSGNPSRKDVTKGFKRLLKFGRKSRGTDSLADWISATTSEGDDDTEDGRDIANRSSEDLRKSRMGLSQGHPSEDSFTESDFYSEQVQDLNSSIPAPPANFRLREDHLSGSSMKAPRSFFSLSTFRSKGSDSKPR